MSPLTGRTAVITLFKAGLIPCGKLQVMKGRVLIIDSDREDSEALSRELRSFGYEVLIEASSRSAVEVAETFAPTAIIADPFANGLDPFMLLREIRVRQPHTPIILTARNRSIETAMRSIQEEGAYHDFEKPIDPEKFNAWIGPLLQEQGPDLLRTKGILAYANEPRRFAFQAVHMIADGDFISEWKDGDPRASRIVFIGRDLNRPKLRRGFEGCVAD